ncbi:hypothetical protein [Flaviaesturariibacter amylovorans]|uniref:Uncharacterized protein n=1 Tax=Flaviaesturariibacter amylovorans TaxID=1084520 RepID=A0ABP8G5W7_9BACT
MDALTLEQCLNDVVEVRFEPSFDRSHAPHAIGLVFGRMTPTLRARVGRLRPLFTSRRVLLYFRPLGPDGMGLSFIVRELLLIANSPSLDYDRKSFGALGAVLHREEPLILAFYQRDRRGRLRLLTDAQYDPYFLPAYYFKTASVLEEA